MVTLGPGESVEGGVEESDHDLYRSAQACVFPALPLSARVQLTMMQLLHIISPAAHMAIQYLLNALEHVYGSDELPV